MSRSDLIDLVLYQHYETDTGYLVSDTESDKNAVWVNKSEVERGERMDPKRPIYMYAIPEWHALKKGLI